MSKSPIPPRRKQLVLLAVVGVLAVGGYLVGKEVWFEWRYRSAVQAERRRDFEAAQRELTAGSRQRPDEPRLAILAARLGWRSRLDDLMPADGWDAPLRKRLKAAATDPLLIERVTREEELIDALSGRLDAVAGMLSRRLKEEDENEVPVLEVLTWSNIVLHRFPAGARAADTLLARQPDHNRGYYWRGLVRELTHAANGLPDADYRRAVELAPHEVSFQIRLAQALSRNLDTRPEALALFEILALARPRDSEVLAGLGRCRLELGNVTSAIPALRAALALTPANGEVMANLGRAMLESGDAAGAEPILRQAVVLAPNARLSNFYLGQCLSQLGRQQDAKPFLEAATRIYADTQRVGELSRQLFQNGSASTEERCQLGELLCRTGHADLGEYWIRSAWWPIQLMSPLAKRSARSLRGQPAGVTNTGRLVCPGALACLGQGFTARLMSGTLSESRFQPPHSPFGLPVAQQNRSCLVAQIWVARILGHAFGRFGQLGQIALGCFEPVEVNLGVIGLTERIPSSRHVVQGFQIERRLVERLSKVLHGFGQTIRL